MPLPADGIKLSIVTFHLDIEALTDTIYKKQSFFKDRYYTVF